MYKQFTENQFPFSNEKGTSKTAIFGVTLTILILVIGIITVYFQYFDKTKFTEEETATATEIAQSELAQALSVTDVHNINKQIEAIQSIGYSEPQIEDSTVTFEKHDETSNYYILLKLQPHETYPNLSRALVQIFDKENGSLITELENVLTWKES